MGMSAPSLCMSRSFHARRRMVCLSGCGCGVATDAISSGLGGYDTSWLCLSFSSLSARFLLASAVASGYCIWQEREAGAAATCYFSRC